MAKKADTDGEAKLSEGEAKSSDPDRLVELALAQQQDLRAQAERSMRTHEQVDTLIKQMAELRADVAELLEHTRALHVQRPRSLTKAEVEQLLKAKPDQSYIVCAPFTAGSLSFRPGDRIDARTRFATPDHLALHVERGLQLTIPPQA